VKLRRFSRAREKFVGPDTQGAPFPRNKGEGGERDMKFKGRIEQLGATGYILLWLLGIPIPILFLFFLLRGCT
jgi:hypothetical protein